MKFNKKTDKREPIKILFIEDESIVQELCGELLEKSGYIVFGLPDTKGMYEILDKKKIDIIICKILFPFGDGFVALEELKAKNKYKDIQFIFFTNLDTEEFKERASRLGADIFLSKRELTPNEFIKEINDFVKEKFKDS